MSLSVDLVALDQARRSALWQKWAQLEAQAAPFASPAFFTLDRALIAGGEALLAVARDGEALVGVLPLIYEHDQLHALRSDHSPGFDYHGAPDGLEAIWRALASDARWTTIELSHLLPDSQLAQRLPALARTSGWQAAAHDGARQRWFALPGFESRLSSKFRSNLQRCARKAGGITHERLTSPGRADVAEALALEASGWKAAAGTSLAADVHAAHLYHALLRLYGRSGRASLHFLRAGGRRIAVLFAVEDADTIYALKIGHDPGASALSPGHLIVWQAAREAEARGLRRFDFVGRDDEWKRKWTDEARELVSLTLYRPSLRGLAGWARHEVLGPRLRRLGVDARHPLPRRCQQKDLVGVHSLGERVVGRVRQGFGIRAALGLRKKPSDGLGAASQFAPGSWVRVRDDAAVRATLDGNAKLRGLAFVPSQFSACGGVFRVDKSVRRIRDDAGRFRAVARTVLLDGVTCAGPASGYPGHEPAGCGRHCPLMFRDEWLEPARDPHHPPPAALHRRHARVRSPSEIARGLDAWGRRDGLTFMPEMAEYAHRRIAVVATISRVFEHDRWVDTPHALYILDGLRCSGAVLGRRGPCDRGCALLWHEDWLILDPVPSC